MARTEVYTDLTPTLAARDQLTEKLPTDSISLSDEIWHFFHFNTTDRTAVARTIALAEIEIRRKCEFVCMGEFALCIGCADDRKTYSYGDIAKGIRENLSQDKLVFVDITDDDSDIQNGKMSKKYRRIVNAFLNDCSEVRKKEIVEQISLHTGSSYCEAPLLHNRLFFVSYGTCRSLQDNFRSGLCTIDFPPLKTEDFEKLLWEFHFRIEEKKKKIDEGFGEETPDEAADPGLDKRTIQWYTNSMAGLEERTVRTILASLNSMSEFGYANYTNTDAVDKCIIRYKKELLAQHDRIEIIETRKEESNQITGLQRLTKWLESHKAAISSFDNPPTGILLVGIPGTGKSAAAKQAAIQLEKPLVRLDMSRILGRFVGDSEKGMREMLEDLKFMAPCVLWIDEIEKAMSGAKSDGGDGGVMERVFGMLLTFIQENNRPIFIVATANDISKLPPEFFRNGRFNQTFCLMMPSYQECVEIMHMKLAKFANAYGWQWSPSKKDASLALDKCVGSAAMPRFLTGADIEAHVKEFFWEYGEMDLSTYTIAERAGRLAEGMRRISESVRAQAYPLAPDTMEKIAECYLNMLQKGMTMASSSGKMYYTKETLRLDNIKYFSYNGKDLVTVASMPLCIEEPEGFKQYRDVRKIGTDTPPEKWYDARFFYELNRAMCDAELQNGKIMTPKARESYILLMQTLQKQQSPNTAKKA